VYNFQLYRQLVHEITETFKKISDEILTIQKMFQAEKEISNIIAKIQTAEQKKLELVQLIFPS